MMPNSLKYIALLSLTAVCHALMPKRGRNALLLAASWLFYLLSMPKYLPLLMVVTGATFLTAKWMENHPDRKHFALTAALLGCFGLLYLYKYLAFTGQLLSMLPADKQEAAVGVLSHDPRPSYQRKPGRIYGIAFAGFDIRFKVADDVLTVEEVNKV